MSARWALVAAVVTGSAGCGDPAWNGAYQGESLLVLDCGVTVAMNDLGARNPIVGIVWLDRDGGRHGGDAVVEGVFPRARVRLMAPAPAELVVFPTANGARVALGQLVLYDDGDGDERFDDGEPLWSITRGMAIVDAPDGASDPDFGDLSPGPHALVANRCREGATAPFAGERPEACYFEEVGPESWFDVDCPHF